MIVRELVFNGDRASVSDNDKVLGMDGGGGCMTMCMFLMPLNFNVHLKMVKF